MTERNGRIHQRLHSRHRKTVSKTKTFRKSWHHTMNINRFPHLFVLKASNKNAPAFYQRTWTKRTTQILGIKQETTQTHTRTHTYTECTAKNPLVICSRQKKKKRQVDMYEFFYWTAFLRHPLCLSQKPTLKTCMCCYLCIKWDASALSRSDRTFVSFPLRCRVCTFQSAAPTNRVDLCRHNT